MSTIATYAASGASSVAPAPPLTDADSSEALMATATREPTREHSRAEASGARALPPTVMGALRLPS